MNPPAASARRLALLASVALGAVFALTAATWLELTPGRAIAALRACVQRDDGEQAREAWQRAPEIMEAMGVAAGSHVADVGAGGGFFTLRLAKAVGPTGRVYAVDIDAKVIERLRDRLAREQIANVELVTGQPDDPRLPDAAIDAALIVNAYHEMRQHQEVLAGIWRALKPGGRLVIVEPISDRTRDKPRSEQQERHEIAADFVGEDLRGAAFEVIERRDAFVQRRQDGDVEWLLVARKPGAP